MQKNTYDRKELHEDLCLFGKLSSVQADKACDIIENQLGIEPAHAGGFGSAPKDTQSSEEKCVCNYIDKGFHSTYCPLCPLNIAPPLEHRNGFAKNRGMD